MSEKETNLESHNPVNDIDFYYLIGILWRYKVFITVFTGVVGVLSIIYVLVATPQYISYISLYPITKDQGGPLKELAATLGLGTKPEGYFLPEVLESRRISKMVVLHEYKIVGFKDSINLLQFWKINDLDLPESRKMEIALATLSGSLRIKDDKETGLINLSIITSDKNLSTDMVNYYCTAITEYLQEALNAQINKSIKFTKDRLLEVKAELTQYEQDLVNFQEYNTKIVAPSLSMEYRKLSNQIEMSRSVFLLLEKQVELLKIEEVRKKPVLNILDKADIYDRPVKPTKRKTVVVNTIVAFILSFTIALFKEKAASHKVIDKIMNEILRSPK
ncbi:MAG: hypothetical protein GQ534_11800 [Candidatus Delongbacteria bacterium]|nr:hypothetical protein [Candidatus Delongbacteria bacterium]